MTRLVTGINRVVVVLLDHHVQGGDGGVIICDADGARGRDTPGSGESVTDT